MCTDVLILAGGSGERLWPVSTAAKPKQFMTLEDGDSFLQSAIRRAWNLGIEGRIIVVTRSDWTGLVVADAVSLARRMGEPGLLAKMLVMSEPFGKNTAPAIAWACRYLLSLDREESPNVLLMASDHIIKPLDSFARDVRTACWYSSERYLSSFSIPPSFPSTGYGYIKAGAAVHSPLDVITSYSIHYTKLYELTAKSEGLPFASWSSVMSVSEPVPETPGASIPSSRLLKSTVGALPTPKGTFRPAARDRAPDFFFRLTACASFGLF